MTTIFAQHRMSVRTISSTSKFIAIERGCPVLFAVSPEPTQYWAFWPAIRYDVAKLEPVRRLPTSAQSRERRNRLRIKRSEMIEGKRAAFQGMLATNFKFQIELDV